MLGSKNNFFSQDKIILDEKRKELEYLVSVLWDRNDYVKESYLKIYDFFCENPHAFDGATIVKDLCIIKNLDTSAMLHDYLYITYKVSSNYKYKWKADLLYALEMERGGGAAYSTWSRFLGLTIFGGIFFTPFKIIKGQKMKLLDKINFNKLYKEFIT
jgi:hypothetical protein